MSLAKKLIYPKAIKRVILALLLVASIATITMGAVFDASVKIITLVQIDEVNDLNAEEVMSTRKLTVGEFLAENNILVGEYDVLNKNVDEEIYDEDMLIIRKGRQIELSCDGKVEFAVSTKKNVGETLEELGVVLSNDDVVTPAVEELVTDGIVITVDRYVTEEITETEAIAFETEKVNKSSMKKGTTKVARAGEEGQKEVVYRVQKKNGEIISKEKLSETVVKEPVNKLIYVGTKKVSSKASKTTSVSNTSGKKDGFSYSKKFTMTATAYSGAPSENGGHTKTAYGLTPKYGVVAVDPKVIPLGTKLYIESSDGGKSWSYGYCIAGDTGGAIKGNKIDLCFNSSSECNRFGRRSATVYVLN